MANDDSGDVKRPRERAFAEHDKRTQEIVQFLQEHGAARIRVNPYSSKINPETLAELKTAIETELAGGVSVDSEKLLSVLEYLRTYDFTCVDEAGYDTPGFSLALSEVDTAYRRLQRDPKNAMRYLVYRYNLKMLANNFQLLSFVPVLHLELSAPCDLRCLMCYQTDPKFPEVIKKMHHKMMPWNIFTKVIDEAAARGCDAVVFAGRGEPTLNRLFLKMIRYCHEKGILDIKFNTNAMTLTEDKVRELLSLDAFLTVVFSVDAGDKKVFEEIRIRSDFNPMENIQRFNKIRREEFPDSPVRTRVNMTIFRKDQDVEKARQLWEPLVDEFSARNANSEQAGSVYQENPDGTPLNVEPGKVCRALFTRVYVWADGVVNPCESDYRSHLQFGNVLQESLQDLWSGPKMTSLREAHLAGKKNSCYPCNGCSAK